MSSSGITETKSRRTKSIAWKYFRIKDKEKKLAVCKICQNVFTYRTCVTNLWKHVKRKHEDVILRVDISDESENEETSKENFSMSDSENDECNDDNSENTKAAAILDSLENKIEEESVCLLCEKTFQDQNSDEMVKHMIEVHNISQIKVVEGNVHLVQEESKMPQFKKRSFSWDYVTITDAETKTAVCNLCDRKLSYRYSVSNIVKHLKLMHHLTSSLHLGKAYVEKDKPRSIISSFFKYLNNEKTVAACTLCHKHIKVQGELMSMRKHLLEKHPEALLHHKTNGDPLFISKANDDNKDDESEEDNMNIEYLDFDDIEKEVQEDIKPVLKRKSAVEQKSGVEQKYSFERRPSYSQGPNFERHPVKFQTELPDSLQFFSNYITSLLQELPAKVSKKLQMDFVRQIIEAQISCAEKGKTTSNEKEDVTKDAPVETLDNSTASADNDATNRIVTMANGIIIRPIVSTP